jgi:hypothetical protein
MSTKMNFLLVALVVTMAIGTVSSVVLATLAFAANPGRGQGTGTAISSCASTAQGPAAHLGCTPPGRP